MFQIILPNNINLAVASYGGVGITFLMEFLSKYKNINNPYDRDGFKHLPIPPLSFNRSLKFIYIYGKPQDAASSLFRRQMHRSQSMKLQSFIASKKIFIPKEMTLQEYASEGKDRFHFQEHFSIGMSIICQQIRYSSLNMKLCMRISRTYFLFAEFRKRALQFPEKERAYTGQINFRETMLQLDEMYGQFSDRLEKLENIEFRQGKIRKIFTLKYINKYRKP